MKPIALIAPLLFVPLLPMALGACPEEGKATLDLQALAAEARASADAPALGVVVWHRGTEPKLAVVGRRRSDAEELATSDDAWHWGSITKSMTATLAARLVERGVISWDDTIDEWLGVTVSEMRSEFRGATLRQLLSHRAGLAANIPLAHFADFGQDSEDPIAERLAWVRIALSQPPVGEPGLSFLYSNDGFIVAGAMLEEATGKSWEELMRREVFEPLGIVGAGFGAPPEASSPRGHVASDGGDQAVPENSDNPAALGPAGRVHMPLRGIARYLRAHADRDEDFLEPATWALLHTPPFGGNYALGWIVLDEDRRWHNGSNTMWFAEAAFDSAAGTVVAVAVNDGDLATVQPAVAGLLQRLLKDS